MLVSHLLDTFRRPLPRGQVPVIQQRLTRLRDKNLLAAEKTILPDIAVVEYAERIFDTTWNARSDASTQ
jgi:hypothetical protein